MTEVSEADTTQLERFTEPEPEPRPRPRRPLADLFAESLTTIHLDGEGARWTEAYVSDNGYITVDVHEFAPDAERCGQTTRYLFHISEPIPVPSPVEEDQGDEQPADVEAEGSAT